MSNREPFVPGEWYHCYSRGVEKRRVFETTRDYQRFVQTLYLANSEEPIHQDNLRKHTHNEIFQRPRKKNLVAIGAYCLMPNHFHLLLKQEDEGGITAFMRKVGTAYTMYFNIKNERVGNLFVKPFRSRRIKYDGHLKHIAHYIHLNPAEIFEPDWKQGNVRNFSLLEHSLQEYRHSSFADYCGVARPEGAILNKEAIELFSGENFSAKKIIADAAEYYRELSWSLV